MITAVGDHGEQAIRRISFDHQGHQLHRRRVEPLHVLAHEQRRSLICETEEQAGQHVERAPPARFGPERDLVTLRAGLDLEQLGDHLDGIGRGPARVTDQPLHGGERLDVVCGLIRVGRPPKMLDDGLEHAVVETWRAAQLDDDAAISPHVLAQLVDDATLADARLAADHGELAGAAGGRSPRAHQQPHLGVPPDQRRETTATNGIDAGLGVGLAEHDKDIQRPVDTLERRGAHRLDRDESLDEGERAATDDDLARFGEGLQTRRNVRRLTDDIGTETRRAGTHLADDDETGVHSDAGIQIVHLQLVPELVDGVDHARRRPDRLPGIVLVGRRKAEVGDNAVTQIVGDEAIVGGDDLDAAILIGAHHATQVLGIEPTGHRRRSDEIGEHHGEVPTLPLDRLDTSPGRRSALGERRPATVAEVVIRRILTAAPRTGPLQRRAARAAEQRIGRRHVPTRPAGRLHR